MPSEIGPHVPAELQPVDAIGTSTVPGHLNPFGQPILRDDAMPLFERDT
jgi:hypothetical protein